MKLRRPSPPPRARSTPPQVAWQAYYDSDAARASGCPGGAGRMHVAHLGLALEATVVDPESATVA